MSGLQFAGHRQKVPVAVLGATGVVGQRFVRRLAAHPLFEPAFLAASERSVGKRYKDACVWQLDGEAWAGMGDSIIVACEPGEAPAPIVFSALDAAPASRIEAAFARTGAAVFSNASAYRMDDDIPLLIPEVNAAHLGLLPRQRAARDWKGSIITNPNCTTVAIAGALAPLERAFGLHSVMVTSLQAISGAGYPGVAAMDIAGNVIPFIHNEESKVEMESNKILGLLQKAGAQASLAPANFSLSATCTRVPVLEGHTVSIAVRLRAAPSLADVWEAFRAFVPDTAGMGLHSAPEQFVRLSDAQDRPQPRRDVDLDAGMAVQVGRLRVCPILGFKFISLIHNTERGAAGASMLNAELAVHTGAVL